MTAPLARDLTPALRTVASTGAAFVPAAVGEGILERLGAEIDGVPLEPSPETVGPVRQQTEAATLPSTLTGYPAVAELRLALMRAGSASGVRGLATWRPDDVSVQRYAEGSVGITSHLDGKRFRRLVAVLTTEGRARFAIRRSREGEVVSSWEVGPGALVLLRGPGLAGVRDGRPFHEVSGPLDGMRTSLSFRMEARP